MANLLTVSAQAQLRRDMRSRFLLTGALGACAAALAALVSLIPAYLALRMNAPAPASAPASTAESAAAVAIADDKTLMALVAPLSGATTTPAEAFAAVLAQRPGGVAVDHLQYSHGANGGQITVSGTAQDPSLVEAYRAALSREPLFTSVSVPLGSLVGATGGRFTITLTGSL